MSYPLKLAAFLILLMAVLAGCGEQSAPTLAVENRPTLVYIYTEG